MINRWSTRNWKSITQTPWECFRCTRQPTECLGPWTYVLIITAERKVELRAVKLSFLDAEGEADWGGGAASQPIKVSERSQAAPSGCGATRPVYLFTVAYSRTTSLEMCRFGKHIVNRHSKCGDMRCRSTFTFRLVSHDVAVRQFLYNVATLLTQCVEYV